MGVEDVSQADLPAAESAVNSETSGYKSCTGGNQKYYQVDVLSHPADPQPANGQPYPRQYEMHAWLGVCSTESETKDGAYLWWNYYYGSDSRYCGGCHYYQIDQIWLRGRAWDCGSLYYDNIASSYPGYVIGEQSPSTTNSTSDCGAQADLQAYWQSNNNWGASAYINQDPNNRPSCSPCINVSQSQANRTGLAAIGTAATTDHIRNFSTVASSRMLDLVQLKDLKGRRILTSTAPLDAWIVVATAPDQSGLTGITGWAVVNARSGAVIAAGQEHTIDGATARATAQGSAIRPA